MMKKSIDTESSLYQLKAKTGKLLISLLERQVAKHSGTKRVFESSKFTWTTRFESNYSTIKKEFEDLKGEMPDINAVSHEQRNFVESKKWRFFPLYIYGVPISKNIDLCPQTAALVKSIPNMTTAFFSCIENGTYIKPHRGAYKGYLRFHFGVDIPATNDSCAIRLEDKLHFWENGKALIFDDTYIHDVWNNSGKERVVLYVDFIRPLPIYLTIVSKLLTKLISKSPYVQNALKNLQSGSYDSIKKALG